MERGGRRGPPGWGLARCADAHGRRAADRPAREGCRRRERRRAPVLRIEGLVVLAAPSSPMRSSAPAGAPSRCCSCCPTCRCSATCAGPRVGAAAYNAAHSYSGRSRCWRSGCWAMCPSRWPLGLIWCAHIGFDRALGYGLKYASGFAATHLGRIGRGRSVVSAAQADAQSPHAAHPADRRRRAPGRAAGDLLRALRLRARQRHAARATASPSCAPAATTPPSST